MAKQTKIIYEHCFKIVLQQLAETEFSEINIDEFDFESFSNSKKMFDYQIESLKSALRVLHKFYVDYQGSKVEFYNNEYKKYPHENLDHNKPNELVQEYYQLLGGRVEFNNFVNRMSFWMTMGSGKTIVIIKLIELLDKAMGMGIVPKKNILFFTANEGLLERFKEEVALYNLLKKKTIETISLKEYEDRKKYISIFDAQQINLFCYRADLMSDERKENILDFKDYLDNGDNYVILDEAHKGDKQDSKRQNIFSILSQNGFLFNFSATFTDVSDIATTVYNLNQAVWVKKGYGKKLFLLDSDLKAFKDKTDLNEIEKQKATLKSLLLLALAKKHKLSVNYHDPMMVVFTNSVNTVDADAELFFRILELIAKDKSSQIFDEVKDDLQNEFRSSNYLIADDDGEGVSEFADQIQDITFIELKESIFHSVSGNIEAIVNPKNKTEIAFKLDSADKPFCLIKIGDISLWLKEKLKAIKIDETFRSKSYFDSLDGSSINILLGSRAFYEGWDTTRPNVMLFLNIGTDKDAKKFVTQSIGRGMRVESIDGSRQRLKYIDTDKKVEIVQDIKPLETLFVVSTNKEAVGSIISWQKEQNKGIDWHDIALEQNEINGKILFIPTYKTTKISMDKIDKKGGFKLSEQNKKDLKIYVQELGENLFALKHNYFNKKECNLFFNMVKDSDMFKVDENIHYKSLDFLIERLRKRLYVKQSDIESFKPLTNEIIHFKKIKIREDKKEDFNNNVQKALKMQCLSDDEVYEKCKIDKISLKDAMEIYKTKEIIFEKAKFQKMINHYYNPIITGDNLDWIRNVISEKSEIKFLKELEKICEDIDSKYDWWMFSKISQHSDKEVYIPYIEDGEEKLFYPDFIFWLQKEQQQTILFIDPKGNRHTDYEHKVDGYINIFENKVFKKLNTIINVKLSLIKMTNDSVGKAYEKYWCSVDSLKKIFI